MSEDSQALKGKTPAQRYLEWKGTSIQGRGIVAKPCSSLMYPSDSCSSLAGSNDSGTMLPDVTFTFSTVKVSVNYVDQSRLFFVQPRKELYLCDADLL